MSTIVPDATDSQPDPEPRRVVLAAATTLRIRALSRPDEFSSAIDAVISDLLDAAAMHSPKPALRFATGVLIGGAS